MWLLMTESRKMNKVVIGSMAALGAMGAVSAMTSPIEAHAAKGDEIAKSTVKVSKNGKVTYAGDLKNGSDGSSWTKLIEKYRFFIAGISGVGAVSMILFFIMNFLKLGATSANPQERSRAITGLVFSGLAAAGLGAVTFIVGIFFNAI